MDFDPEMIVFTIKTNVLHITYFETRDDYQFKI